MIAIALLTTSVLHCQSSETDDALAQVLLERISNNREAVLNEYAVSLLPDIGRMMEDSYTGDPGDPILKEMERYMAFCIADTTINHIEDMTPQEITQFQNTPELQTSFGQESGLKCSKALETWLKSRSAP